jgi:3-methyladenine DNA glycosylase Mpg
MLQIADDGTRPNEIEITPRIGLRKAVDRPLRFLVTGPKKLKKWKSTFCKIEARPASCETGLCIC